MSKAEELLKWDLGIKEVKSNNYLVEEYCHEKGLTLKKQYYYWHKKIKDIDFK